jgi:CubicO group peptidase (beta-lactamase class C family)
MHVAGGVAEAATGTGWVELAQTRLANPLGIGDLTWDGIGTPQNPRIAGGAATSLGSYAAFLTNLAAGDGPFDDPAVRTLLLSDQANDAALGYAPPNLTNYLGYGLGTFVMRRYENGQPMEFASPGAFGTYPWIDLENEYVGVLVIDARLDDVIGFVDDVRAFAADHIDAAPALPGDANRDGTVDLIDFGILRRDFGTTPGRFIGGDFNGDGTVNLTDFGILRTNFGNASDAPNAADLPAPIPAPTLLWPAAALLLPRRR